ncbi:lasso peptide biosynthesis protein [candidate division TA06 bacterium]|uniref:Lasso peptide biosynthesis protein n=1 Tax=candidate division TA06 bacterium TaxID=2250710 RepID=A0A933I6U9_UNCT6|nr:lasso peptide biosynthesis protein [candidate division TA06 bacterium]
MSKKALYLMLLGLVWSGSLVWFGLGRAGCQPAEHKVRPRALSDSEQWHGIYYQYQKIGHSVTLTRVLTQGGQAVSNKSLMRLPLMGEVRQVSTVLNYELDRNYRLTSFEFKMAGAAEISVKGRVQGKQLSLEILSNGQSQSAELDIPGSIVMPEALEPMLIGKSLTPGKEYDFSVFDPASMAVVPLLVKVIGPDSILLEGRWTQATKLEISFSGSKSHAWVDSLGQTVKEDGPLGITMIRQTKEQALALPKDFPEMDLLSNIAVPALNGGLPKARETERMVIAISGVSLKELDVSGGRQAITDSQKQIVQITTEQTSELQPVNGKPDKLEEYLMPTVLIQSEDEDVKQLALKLTKGLTDPWQKALVLEKWVYENLEKTMTVSLPSAVEVLQSRRGDCNEHATLFAALARAAGLPAKICLGVVYLDGKFYYHAWNSVYCGKWIELDPTFGQAPADAARLRLVEGDLSQQTRLLSAFGNLKIEILEHRP